MWKMLIIFQTSDFSAKKDGGEEAVKGNWRAVFALARSEEVLLKDAADCLF